MFKPLDKNPEARVTIHIEDREVSVAAGLSVAAALLSNDIGHFRTTPVTGSPRAPYCMMGVCFDCLVEIDGAPNMQACLVEVCDGMTIRRQTGARQVTP